MLYISHEPSERVGGLPPSLSDCCELDAKRAHVNASVFARLFPELFHAINESSRFKSTLNLFPQKILFRFGDNITENFFRFTYLNMCFQKTAALKTTPVATNDFDFNPSQTQPVVSYKVPSVTTTLTFMCITAVLFIQIKCIK